MGTDRAHAIAERLHASNHEKDGTSFLEHIRPVAGAGGGARGRLAA